MQPLFSVLLVVFATLGAGQKYFINTLSAYSALPSCAEKPLSFIVRDMVSGCGDNKKTTSYSCFCTASSSKMKSIINSAVASRCSTGPTNAATQALDVFSSYCDLGASNKIFTGNATSPASVNATITQTVTSTPSLTMPVETALSPIPSTNIAGERTCGARVPLYAIAIILVALVTI
ncbi:hypothetical protein F5B19DRAFT_470236 [Rostrohypoxylon terebratum]|nr:hypothetical protein F5B19DRAFT_470236 [Rostrohypoxylon terebratum]